MTRRIAYYLSAGAILSMGAVSPVWTGILLAWAYLVYEATP